MGKRERILIVGGVAGGASAAARARRLSEDAEIIMFERGEYVSFANCGLPYHIGGKIPERERLLVQTPQSLFKRFRIDVRINSEVVSINREKKEITVENRTDKSKYTEHYDKLILSPGASPVKPPIPGADSPKVYSLRNMEDMDSIKKALDKISPQRAIVVGGGYIGLEITEALRERGIAVTLVELAPQVMVIADPEMTVTVKQQLTLNGVDLRLNTSITSVQDSGDRLAAVLSTGETVECGMIIMSIGVRPDVKIAANAGLKIGETGGIEVDDHMRTSDPDIFAAGDAVEVIDFTSGKKALVPLAGPANRQGRIAADNALGRDSAYRKTQGTAICKVFDTAVGSTGMSEKQLKKFGMTYEKVYVHPASHATYYPGASPISLKLLFDPSDGKILGAQAAGSDGVDKRLDVLAVAMRAGMTVYDLEHLELTYAPPFGSAKDPVNYAGFTASNIMRGDVKVCHYADVANPKDDQMILDVRTSAEVMAGTIPGAVHIPVDDLRDRLDSLPKNKEILVTCQVGLRGYVACRILTQHGFNCRNLSGGYKTYTAFSETLPTPATPPSVPSSEDKDMKDDTGECDTICRTGDAQTAQTQQDVPIVKEIDATGLQCPGPIMRLKDELESVESGKAASITVSDPGFITDIPAWCKSAGHVLMSVSAAGGGKYRAVIQKKTQPAQLSALSGEISPKNKTIVVFSAEFDRVMAAFIIANGAVSMGSNVTMFFTFWGLNALRKKEHVAVHKNFLERMFGMMMPRGADKLKLSNMHMWGFGLDMMKGIMKGKNVQSLEQLIGAAKLSGVKLVACSMTMDVMGIKKEELIEGVETGGVAMYLGSAESGTVNLFI